MLHSYLKTCQSFIVKAKKIQPAKFVMASLHFEWEAQGKKLGTIRTDQAAVAVAAAAKEVVKMHSNLIPKTLITPAITTTATTTGVAGVVLMWLYRMQS